MFDYLIDTADIGYITNIEPVIRGTEKNMLGITTNPNAMDKVGCTSLSDWQQMIPRLCQLVSAIRQDDNGKVHVQAPNSNMSGVEVVNFAKRISKYTDGKTRLVLKIFPTISILEYMQEIRSIMPVNVTGLSDCSTALSCLSHGVDYVSMLTGRMEEVSIDANSHLLYLQRRSSGHVIAGSMRTVKGLADAVSFGTIPTIGTRVWDAIIKEQFDITTLSKIDMQIPTYSPDINYVNRRLSTEFFDQMDKLGAGVYADCCVPKRPTTEI
jgi:transaldolase